MAEPAPFVSLRENLQDVDRLLEIHTDLTGDERGRRFDVEVLNKSAVVLATACWEAFVEDLATAGFDFLLATAPDWSAIPSKVRVPASRGLRADVDENKVWGLAGSGWKTVLQNHKAATIQEFTGHFNTPKADRIDGLFKNLLGLPQISDAWHWQKMSRDDARKRLDRFVTLRGAIAHRVAAAAAVTKKDATDFRRLVLQLAVKSSNATRKHIYGAVEQYPWDELTF